MASELVLEIVTPFGKTFSDGILSCTIPGSKGQFQVLKDHAAMMAEIAVGPIKLERLDKKTQYLATSGGFCEVKDNLISIIVESAEFADQIDVSRAQSAKERAEKRIASKDEYIELDRARLALLRAVNRLKVAQLK